MSPSKIMTKPNVYLVPTQKIFLLQKYHGQQAQVLAESKNQTLYK